MTPGRLSRRSEFTPVPSYGSTFVYMSSLARHPGVSSPRLLYRGGNFTNEISQRYHVSAKRPHVSV